jgi:hypothetical protein
MVDEAGEDPYVYIEGEVDAVAVGQAARVVVVAAESAAASQTTRLDEAACLDRVWRNKKFRSGGTPCSCYYS